jgi:hypothetical protein
VSARLIGYLLIFGVPPSPPVATPPSREELALVAATEALVSANLATRRQLTAGERGGFHRHRTDRDVLEEVDEIVGDAVADVFRWSHAGGAS